VDAVEEQLDSLKSVKAPTKTQTDTIDKLVAEQSKDIEALNRVTVRLLAAQNTNGGWAYSSEVLNPQEEARLLDLFRKDETAKTFTPTIVGRDDNSINQFVMLALWTARRHELKTDSALLRIEQRYREVQNKDGSWSYIKGDEKLKDATTCAGLIGLAVGQAIKAEGDKDKAKAKKGRNILKDDKEIARGVDYLSRAVGRTKNIAPDLRTKRHKDTDEMLRLIKDYFYAKDQDERKAIGKDLAKLDQPDQLKGTLFSADAWGDLYFLWSVERVAVVYDLKKIGEKDWYEWGRELILKFQNKDGSWQDRFPGIPDTCFALLFLKRANVVKDLTNKLLGLNNPVVAARNPSPVPPQQEPKDRKKD
jgi:hypothetical protein